MNRLETFAFLICAILLLSTDIGVIAKGGKGGGGEASGDSSSDGGDGGDGGGVGAGNSAKADPYRECIMEKGNTNPLWLHQWTGTYYNGSIEITIDSPYASCSNQSSMVTETYNGVLSIFRQSYADAKKGHPPFYEDHPNPFVFILDGWNTTTTPAELLASHNSKSGLPPAIKLDFVSVMGLNRKSVARETERSWGHPALCEVGNVTRSNAGYDFTCQYDEWERVSYFGLVIPQDQFSIPLSTCNGSSTFPFLAERNASTLLHGNFNPTSADFRWDGMFKGDFSTSDINNQGNRPPAGYRYERPSYPILGSFMIRFSGEVDAEHSHEMVLGAGDEIDWVEDVNKTKAFVLCAEFIGDAISARLSRELWLMGIVFAGWSLLWML